MLVHQKVFDFEKKMSWRQPHNHHDEIFLKHESGTKMDTTIIDLWFWFLLTGKTEAQL